MDLVIEEEALREFRENERRESEKESKKSLINLTKKENDKEGEDR